MNRCLTLIALLVLFISQGFSQERPRFVYAKSQGTTNGDYPSNMATDLSGNIYTVGTFHGTADFDPGSGVISPTVYGNGDIFISKLDRDGNFVWIKSVGGTNDDFGGGITVDASGNIHVVGTYSGTADFDPNSGSFPITSSASSDVFILKLDTDGNFIWAKSVGGPLTDASGSVEVDAAGNVFVAGTFRSASADFDPGTSFVGIQYYGQGDGFILKLDVNGNFVWAKGFGGNSFDSAAQIAVDNSSGSIYVTGYFTGLADFDPSAVTTSLTSAGPNDSYVAKFASDGSLTWVKQIGGAGADSRGAGIDLGVSGDVYVLGVFKETVDFDPGTGTFTMTYPDDFTGYLCKLNSAGNFVWAKQLGGRSPQTMMVDASENIYIAGISQGTLDYDPGPGEYFLTPTFGYGTFLTKLDVSGSFVWATMIGGVGGGTIKSCMTVDNSGDVVSVGSYEGVNGDFDPSACVYNMTGGSIYTLKLKQSAVATDPTISSFVATSGPVGTTVTITGTNFSTTPSDNVVVFNSTTAVVTASTATSITTTVPAGATTGKISVTTACITATSATDFTVTGPNGNGSAPVISTATGSALIGGIGTIDLLPLLTDADNNLDLSTLKIIEQPSSGATATINSNRELIIDYEGSAFSGTDEVTIEVCDQTGKCTQQILTVEVSDSDINIFNAVSPNGDGKNDILYIHNIDVLADTRKNKVIIYNRWGDIVFDVNDYDNVQRVFNGESNRKTQLPSGVYYYKIEFSSSRRAENGYLVLRR